MNRLLFDLFNNFPLNIISATAVENGVIHIGVDVAAVRDDMRYVYVNVCISVYRCEKRHERAQTCKRDEACIYLLVETF